ncbi:hypothetical protein [Geodermatophilus maliterrae]|uniref:Uncharacterized protein n=1 Tax=Geodermatophilus maliterrae TaxID=3162531 RepID=A0ABV3XCA7_9ACTN
MSTPATGGWDGERQIAALGVELAHVRARGLDSLDLPLGGHGPVAAPILELLARAYSDDWATARGPHIRQLLLDGLAAWQGQGHQSEAALVRRLFFPPDGTPADASLPGRLLDAAEEASGRSKASFEKHRRAAFRLFAAFLIDFVELGARAPSSLPPAVVSDGPPAARGRRRRRLLRSATAVAGGVGVALVVGLHPDSAEASATFRFDALGGGSPYIRVFPGVGPDDLVHNGTFMDGQTVPAVCKTTGRLVVSDPSVGERPRQSDVWVQIIGSPGLTQFARLTYGDIDPQALAALPEC